MTAQETSFSTSMWRQKLNQYLQTEIAKVDQQPQLQASMAYSLLAGGKRIRPLLYLAAVAAKQSIVPETDLAIAGSLELVHTYSLIHDDLPAMDNDDYRRGRLTNHRQFGEAMAILAGDGLLTLAFQWLGQVSLPQAGQLCAILAQASGPQGMVAGQAIDIQQTGQSLTALDQVAQLDALKTGALLTAPLRLAACRLMLPPEMTTHLVDFGHHFGVAFQIFDDLQDIHSTAEKMGKAVHKDQEAGKNTYPAQLGVAGAQAALAAEVQAAQLALTALPENWHDLAQFLQYFDGEIK
ncbi:polyprenyl synthetase family protein [Lapidilactobacillus gannanensis]|uniref:Polyprenyl synthetase family protein n=1 Tax=Lapidilactobacillus gannanensis TaxID=2486002 RepID=A0ABW4BSJ7_9LACO|nr:farnesyl diphosphate synthase [Lapidilactobacillus gannanensis]